MLTHEDEQHRNDFFKRLKERAEAGKTNKTSEITAGNAGEAVLAKWKSHGVMVVHMPDDEQKILRISIGGGETPIPLNYCTIRGPIGPVIDLLELSLKALKEIPE